MNAQPEEILVYLDHNVLDSILKGDADNIEDIINTKNFTPVFSSETLNEIIRSKGYEEKFVEVLDRLGARYMVPLLDDNYQYTGQASLSRECASMVFRDYAENYDPMPEYGYGLRGMLEKFYDGRTDETFRQVFSSGLSEVQSMFAQADQDITDLDDEFAKLFSEYKEMVPAALEEVFQKLTETIAENDEPSVATSDRAPGIGPKTLKNIKPPNIVKQIIQKVAENNSVSTAEIEKLFQHPTQLLTPGENRDASMVEKIQAVYHQLNFLGYYRDSKMKKSRRFKASFSDLTHAGFASYCNWLFTWDKDFAMKVGAAYEYLGVSTKIWLIVPKNGT